jgi:hypothetical protein
MEQRDTCSQCPNRVDRPSQHRKHRVDRHDAVGFGFRVSGLGFRVRTRHVRVLHAYQVSESCWETIPTQDNSCDHVGEVFDTRLGFRVQC